MESLSSICSKCPAGWLPSCYSCLPCCPSLSVSLSSLYLHIILPLPLSLSLSPCQAVCIFPSIYLSVYLCVYLSSSSTLPPIYMRLHLSINLPVDPSHFLLNHLSIPLLLCQSVPLRWFGVNKCARFLGLQYCASCEIIISDLSPEVRCRESI